MRFVYSILITLVALFLPIKLLIRSIKEPLYRKFISERYGLVRHVKKGRIWIHCISVGEAIAAKALCESLLEKNKLIITCTTASGREQLNRMYVNQIQDDLILVSYIPVDVSIFNNLALRRWRPSQVIFVETDIWPNICRICKNNKIPIKLINARLSIKSFNGYRKLGSFFTATINCFDIIATQFKTDADHFIKLGLLKNKIHITGSIKADIAFDQTQRSNLMQLKESMNRPVWLAASTHSPEELTVLDIHKQILKLYPEALLIIAPRHPNRFNEVADIISSNSFNYTKRSTTLNIPKHVNVYLADSIGELLRWMVISDVVFMGKSLDVMGGHNPLEPAYLSKAIISGGNVSNFENIYGLLEQKNGAVLINSSDELFECVSSLINDDVRREQLGKNANDCYKEFSGALSRTLVLIH
ncbi:MAG: 3-deoxy-D-manno-octulosonic acid transferase [Saccharospirillaceae bacterium]|nr:3-deoxy-D-manno-octulosonic acid transferase [Pseudomonadales bacterium]NRB79765.1 3-deoxy-D-manno-octulosonic acid transferase [Saccharospirillaceae bacterium]